MIPEREATIAAADGVRLEARLAVPPRARAGLVCGHPHPLYGGDMDNPVVMRVVEVAGALGLATCRFNFRGVGRSTGMHGHGLAERADMEAALDHLEAEIGDSPGMVVAGYSFGSMVAARVGAGERRLDGVVLVAPPLAMAKDGPFLDLAARGVPVLIVAGSDDEYCPEPALQSLGDRLPAAHVTVVDGANHFFAGGLAPLGEAVGAWLEARQAGRRAGPA